MTKTIRTLFLLLPVLFAGCTQSFDAASQLQGKNLVVTAHFDDDFTAIYQGLLGTKQKSLNIKKWEINEAVAAGLAKSLQAQGYRATSGTIIKPGDLRVAIVPAKYKDFIWNKNAELPGIGVYRMFEMVDEHVVAFASYKVLVLNGDTTVSTQYGQFKLNMGTERWADNKYWETPTTEFPNGVESIYRQVVINHFEKLYPFSLPSRAPSMRKKR